MAANNRIGGRFGAGFLSVSLLAATLGACGVSSNVLPAENAEATSFASYAAVEGAYDKVKVGETNTQGLSELGFNLTAEPNAERFSYLAVMQRFMPDPAIKFEDLAPGIQRCINAQDRCTALVFRPARIHAQRTGGVVTDFLAFERVSVETGWAAEVVFLISDGTVVYKTLQGKPSTQEVRDLVQPLGPATNLGDAIVRVGKGFGGKL